MYLPGFPAIANSLHTSIDKVAYSLSSFFLGVCLGQLVCGPLLDRFGRKIILLIGLSIYIGASIGCSLSNSVEMLVVFRFLQALGGCVGMVAPGAIVRDLFPVSESPKIFSMLILILGVSPILAPTVGSFMIAHFNWHSVFIVLALVTGTILAVVAIWLPESKGADVQVSLKPMAIAKAYRDVLRERQFVTYSFAGAIGAASLFAYLAGSPFVFMKLYMVSEQHYGLIFAAIAAGLITCSQLNNLLLKKFSSPGILRTAISVQASIGLVLVAGTYFNFLELYGSMALLLLFLSCQGFSFPNSAAMAMAPFHKGAGSASALMGATQMAFGATASALVGVFFNGTALPLTAIMALCSGLGLIILITGQRRLNS
jgi:DHA1 family bicyclomycin/chloramphenicol resistance-like MFS transporter